MTTVYANCVDDLLRQISYRIHDRAPSIDTTQNEELRWIVAQWLYEHDVPIEKKLREIIQIETPDHSSLPRSGYFPVRQDGRRQVSDATTL